MAGLKAREKVITPWVKNVKGMEPLLAYQSNTLNSKKHHPINLNNLIKI